MPFQIKERSPLVNKKLFSVIDKLSSVFLAGEDIDDGRALQALIHHPANAPIFPRLGMSFGKVILMKDMISEKLRGGSSKRQRTQRQIMQEKLGFADLSVMSQKRKTDYLRKSVFLIV